MWRETAIVKASTAFAAQPDAQPSFTPTKWSLFAQIGVVELSLNGTDVDYTLTAGETPLQIQADAPVALWARSLDENAATLHWAAGDDEEN